MSFYEQPPWQQWEHIAIAAQYQIRTRKFSYNLTLIIRLSIDRHFRYPSHIFVSLAHITIAIYIKH